MTIYSDRENGASTGPAVLGRSPFKGMLWSDFLIPIGELLVGALLVVTVVLLADGRHSWALVTILLSALVATRAYVKSEGSSVSRHAWFALFAAAMICLLILDQSPRGQALTLLLVIGAGVLFLLLSLDDAKERAQIEKHTALLLFEGRLGNRQYYDQRLNFCRALLSLSHRTKRPLSVIALRWVSPTTLANPLGQNPPGIVRGIDQHLQRFEIATTIEKAVRGSDVVLVDADENLILIICPDTHSSGALRLALRLSVQVQKDAKSLVNHSIASYPEDAYHFEELVSAAVCRMKKARANGSDHGAFQPRAAIQVKKVADNTRQPVAPSNGRLGL